MKNQNPTCDKTKIGCYKGENDYYTIAQEESENYSSFISYKITNNVMIFSQI